MPVPLAQQALAACGAGRRGRPRRRAAPIFLSKLKVGRKKIVGEIIGVIADMQPTRHHANNTSLYTSVSAI